MTRMWGIDPQLLCNQHLLGEHTEMHLAVGTIQKHPHGEAIVRGHAEREQLDTARIQARHDELATEMERRGMDHESPLAYNDRLGLGHIDLDANLADLKARCPDCRARIEQSRS